MPDQLFTFVSQPGVRRDGTELDSPFYADGVWVRWQRGKPRKMGGYRATSLQANGPTRHTIVDARNGVINAHYMSKWGIQRQAIAASGAAGALDDRTPLVFAPNDDYTWTTGLMYSAVGSTFGAFLACATPDASAIDSDGTGNIYVGDATTNDLMTVVADGSGAIAVSGGICVLQPFLFAYGSNGLIRNSKANDFSSTGWASGGGSLANTANVAGTKIVYGTAIRGGTSSPAGLFWALDSLIRVTFAGGSTIWNYDTLASPPSPMSKRGIVEFDGKFIWPTLDRFMIYTGVVQEVPNDFNQNWFFDNLNYAARNKVWGTKIARFGEVWWFYPRGNATECTDAVIYNYRENCWYDAHLARSAGDKAGTFRFPVWVGSEDGQATTLVPTGTRGSLSAQTNAGLSAPTQNPATSGATGGTGLTAGTTYFYKITALTASGESLPSNEVSITASAGIAPPTATTISTSSSGGTGGLAPNTTYFYKVTGLNGAGETTGSNELSITTQAGIASPTATTLTTSSSGGTGLSAATTYFYKVTATNALGETLASNELSVTTPAGLSVPTLGAPTTSAGGSLATSTTYFYKVTALNAVGETTPSSEQSATTSSGAGGPTLTAAPAYTIDGSDPWGLAANTTYFYKVTAIVGGAETAASNEVSGAVPAAVAAPTAVSVEVGTDGTVPVANYDVYVAVLPFPSSGIHSDATLLGNVTTTVGNQTIIATWNLATRDDNGYILVCRNTADGTMFFSGGTSGTTQLFQGGGFMGGWTEFPIVNQTAKGSFALSWSAVGGATSYNLYRGTSTGAENLVKSVGNVTSFNDHGDGTSGGSVPSAGQTVNLSWSAITGATGYRVYRGTSAGAENVFQAPGNVTSLTDNGTTFASSGSPPGINSTVKATTTLSWGAVTGATGYNVYRGTSAGAEGTKYAAGNVTSFTDTGAAGSAASPPGSDTSGGLSTNTVNWGLVSGATSYRVYRGTGAGAESVFFAPGNVATFTDTGGAGTAGTVPTTNTTASATSSNGISWGAVTGATGYKVYRGLTTGGENVFYSPGNVTSFTDTGAASSSGSPPTHDTTSSTLTFTATPAGVVNGMTVYADPFLAPGTTVTGITGTTVTLSSSPLLAVPTNTVIAFSTQSTVILPTGQTVTGGSSGATGTIVRTSYVGLNLKDVAGAFITGEALTLSTGPSAKVFAAAVAQQLDAVYQHEFGFDKIVGQEVRPILSSFTSQNYGLAVGAPFKPSQSDATADIMTRVSRMEPDFNLIGDATLIVEGRSFAQQKNKVLQTYNLVAGQEFQDMREQERILRFTLQSNSVGGFFEQGQVLITMGAGDERSNVSV